MDHTLNIINILRVPSFTQPCWLQIHLGIEIILISSWKLEYGYLFMSKFKFDSNVSGKCDLDQCSV